MNGTNVVTVVPAPAVHGMAAFVQNVIIHNDDTASNTITFRFNDSAGSPIILVKQTLNAGDSLTYEHGTGWSFTTPNIAPYVDTTNLVKGSADATKQLRIEVDGLTTNTTRVWTAPDADLTVVGTATTQTLTNKTITIADNAFTIQDNGDPTKQFVFQASGISAGQTRVVTVPDADATIASPATQAQMEAAAVNTAYSAPSTQHFHPGHPKAWGYATVAAGTPTLQASYNITSITDEDVGRITFTIATDYSTANWSVSGSIQSNSNYILTIEEGAHTAQVTRLRSYDPGGAALADPTAYSMMGCGDQA